MKGFLQKMAYTLQTIILFSGLGLSGYEGEAETQTALSQNTISVMTFVIPPILVLISFLVFSKNTSFTASLPTKCTRLWTRGRRIWKRKRTDLRILIIRHAEPDYAKDSLTEKGWREAEFLADKLEHEKIDACYLSPLGRAQDTAKVTLAHRAKAKTLGWLREFHAPVYDKITKKSTVRGI